MTTDRQTPAHPVTLTLDGSEAIFVLGAIQRNIAWLEALTADPVTVPTVLKWLRSAAEKVDKATYGDESLADGEFYAGMNRTVARCTCNQTMDAKHAPGCLLFEDVRGWDDTRVGA
jgi:hypothetical protein